MKLKKRGINMRNSLNSLNKNRYRKQKLNNKIFLKTLLTFIF